jgi:hypothetical protein
LFVFWVGICFHYPVSVLSGLSRGAQSYQRINQSQVELGDY